MRERRASGNGSVTPQKNKNVLTLALFVVYASPHRSGSGEEQEKTKGVPELPHKARAVQRAACAVRRSRRGALRPPVGLLCTPL